MAPINRFAIGVGLCSCTEQRSLLVCKQGKGERHRLPFFQMTGSLA
jgi:hypothetical protein